MAWVNAEDQAGVLAGLAEAAAALGLAAGMRWRRAGRCGTGWRLMGSGACWSSITQPGCLLRGPSGHKPRSDLLSEVRSGGRGIRTHGDVAVTMVFKTIAIGH